MKKVSVIIPTYDRVNYLKLTLDSVINQTYSNIEIIVVDDGSPNEDTEKLCRSYQNIFYIKIENSGGPANPRNIGFTNSTGDFIAFLDDDDIWLPHKITDQVSILEQHQEFGLVHSYCEVIDGNGMRTGEVVGKPRDREDKHGDCKLKMTGNWTLMMPTPLIRRSVVEEVGLFDTEIPAALEDVEFWTRCSFYTKFYYLDQPLALYRIHDNNISSHKTKYLDLPVYLKSTLNRMREKDRITPAEFKVLNLNLCLSQARYVSLNLPKTLLNLFKLNPFWIINFRIIKTLVKRLINE